MGIFGFLFKTQDEKIRDYAISVIEYAHAYAVKGKEIKRSYISKFDGYLEGTEYSWKIGTIASRYKESLQANIEEIASDEFTQFMGEDKDKLLNLLKEEVGYVNEYQKTTINDMKNGGVNTRLKSLEKNIMNRANFWAPAFDSKHKEKYGKVIYKNKFDEILNITKKR